MLNLFTLATVALVAAAPMQLYPNGVCPKIVGLGEHCGGFINNAPKCGAGLVCKLEVIADVGGTCVADANADGAPLGGACNISSPCKFKDRKRQYKYLHRLIEDQMFSIISLIAIAAATPFQVQIAGLGKHCGGFMGDNPKCGPGLYCKLVNIPDVGGVCQLAPGVDKSPMGAYCEEPIPCVEGTVCKKNVCELLE
ncbi:hypothetical protein HDV06_005490 [Boothiomyces sp. JEL0866]|nr:hypothetical protein HDV06_005490 [Boothiomyces sp. JEL0866]